MVRISRGWRRTGIGYVHWTPEKAHLTTGWRHGLRVSKLPSLALFDHRLPGLRRSTCTWRSLPHAYPLFFPKSRTSLTTFTRMQYPRICVKTSTRRFRIKSARCIASSSDCPFPPFFPMSLTSSSSVSSGIETRTSAFLNGSGRSQSSTGASSRNSRVVWKLYGICCATHEGSRCERNAHKLILGRNATLCRIPFQSRAVLPPTCKPGTRLLR